MTGSQFEIIVNAGNTLRVLSAHDAQFHEPCAWHVVGSVVGARVLVFLSSIGLGVSLLIRSKASCANIP